MPTGMGGLELGKHSHSTTALEHLSNISPFQPTRASGIVCAHVRVRRCMLRDFHGGVRCMWVVQCFTTQYDLQETVNHYLL